MKDFPGGTLIVLEGTTEKEGVDLVMVEYKYNKSKVLCFVMTRGVGLTKKGKPYKEKFPNCFGIFFISVLLNVQNFVPYFLVVPI